MSEPTEMPDEWINEPENNNQKLATRRASSKENSDPLKTNYKDPKKRYELSERMVWAKLPQWKKDVIIKGKLTDRLDDRIIDEYAHEIAKLAENETVVLSENLPPVPSFTLKGKHSIPIPLTN